MLVPKAFFVGLVIGVISFLFFSFYIVALTEPTYPERTEEQKLEVLIEAQNYCLELGDCLGRPTELVSAPGIEGNQHRCIVLNSDESWYEKDLSIVKSACNAFDRLGVFGYRPQK